MPAVTNGKTTGLRRKHRAVSDFSFRTMASSRRVTTDLIAVVTSRLWVKVWQIASAPNHRRVRSLEKPQPQRARTTQGLLRIKKLRQSYAISRCHPLTSLDYFVELSASSCNGVVPR